MRNIINGKGASSSNFWLGLAVVVLVLIAYSNGAFSFLGLSPQSTTGGAIMDNQLKPINPNVQTCPVPGNTLTIGPMKEKNVPATSMSSENARVYINNVDQGSKSDSSTMTVNAGANVEIIYGISSSTHFSDYAEFSMPCGPLSSAEIGKSGSPYYNQDYANAHQLWQFDTQPSLLAFNGDTGNLNNGTGVDNETIGASGDTGRFGIKFTTVADKALAAPRHGPVNGKNKVYVVVEVNGTLYDSSKTLLSGASVSTYSPSTTVLTLANAVDALTVFEADGCPVDPSRSCNLDLGQLLVQTKSGAGNDPGVLNTGLQTAASVGNGAIKITLIQADYYRQTIDNTIQFGPQKDDGSYAFNRGVVNSYFLSTA